MDTKIGMIIGLFIIAILGLIFTQTIGDQTREISTTYSSVNESITFSGGSGLIGNTYLRANDKIIDVTQINNGTNNTIGSSNWNDYVNGSVILGDGAIQDGAQGLTPTLYITYSYYPEKYVRDGTSRVLTGLIILFFAIGLLLMIVGKSIGLSPEIFNRR